jgi:hypothetical protein
LVWGSIIETVPSRLLATQTRSAPELLTTASVGALASLGVPAAVAWRARRFASARVPDHTRLLP